MKLKQIALFSTIAVFLLLVTGKSLYMYIQGQKDYKRILASQQNLTKQLVYYKDKQGHETAKTPVLQYTKKELDNVLPDVNTLLKTLKIKPKQTESVAEIATTQHKDIITRLYDTIFTKNNIADPTKLIMYSDDWYNVTGTFANDTARLSISSVDTLVQVISKGERLNPWLWFFSKRQLIQTIQCRNPSNHIVYSRYIKIIK